MATLTLLKNADLYAPDALGMQNLLIGGGQILAVSADKPTWPGIDTYDCAGRRVVPGFIDGHAHVTGGGGEAGFSTRVPAPSLSEFTAAGVTSVVGVLGTDDTTRDTRSLLAQTYALRELGLGAWCHTGGYHIPPVTFTGSVRDDIVFLDPVIGVGELAISDHRSSQPQIAELLRIASDAHVAGMISGKAGILHLHLGDGERGLSMLREAISGTELPARVFNPTHINRREALFNEAIEAARQGSYVDITAYPVEEGDDSLPAHVALIRYLESGAPAGRVTVSSDGGGCLPVFNDEGAMTHMDVGRCHELGKTLRAAIDAGVPLEAVLPAFTQNVAELLRLHGRGKLAAGFRADLVVLGQDSEVDSVMIGGLWHRKDGSQLVRGQFENES